MLKKGIDLIGRSGIRGCVAKSCVGQTHRIGGGPIKNKLRRMNRLEKGSQQLVLLSLLNASVWVVCKTESVGEVR